MNTYLVTAKSREHGTEWAWNGREWRDRKSVYDIGDIGQAESEFENITAADFSGMVFGGIFDVYLVARNGTAEYKELRAKQVEVLK